MASVTVDDLHRMHANLLFDGEDARHKLSRFWVLLVAASVIAAAGVVSDSTATVIGAMIVAPLMTPILGTVFSIVTADRRNLIRSLALVAGGAAAAIAIGWLFGAITVVSITSETSSQVAGRISPRLIDLVAALATGAVGAFAQCREDISDTLPGVAIAISLVPPLSVVGLTWQAGAGSEALGALLLFGTNVAAILLSGSLVMVMFRVHRQFVEHASKVIDRRKAAVVVAVLVAAVAIPLTAQTARLAQQRNDQRGVASIAHRWAAAGGWRVVSVDPQTSHVVILVAGNGTHPDPAELRRMLDEGGMKRLDVVVSMIPEDLVELPGH